MSNNIAIPTTPEQITADWLTKALRAGGVIEQGTAVSHLTKTRIGEDEAFTGGLLLRIEIEYVPTNQAAPRSLVAKTSAADPELRAAMKGGNLAEGRFYGELSSQKKLPVPDCYYGDFDPDSGTTILLIEDLGQFRAVSFFTGSSHQEATNVIQALAQIHTHFWNNPQLNDMPPYTEFMDLFPFREMWLQYPQKVAEILPDLDIPDSFFYVGEQILKYESVIFNHFYRPPITCIHRDIHVDNILFGQQSDDTPALILDWQTYSGGRGIYDIAYFLITSTPSAQRRQTEKDLVRLYHTRLVQSGITGYSFEQCWFDYRLSGAGKFYTTILATLLVDNSTTHKKKWRQTDLQRLSAFCDDHDLGDFLANLPAELNLSGGQTQ